jgi:hypothetical protein
MTERLDEPHRSGLMIELFSRLLAFLDRPWKAAALGVFLVLAGLGYFLHAHHAELLEAWLTPEVVELNSAEIPASLDTLVAETGADLVQIWQVDLSANSQRFLGARRKDGERPVIPAPRRLPAIVATSDIKALNAVLTGHPTCGDATTMATPLMRRLADRGMQRVCAMPIPPSAEAFVGIIYMAWVEPPDEGAEAVALSAAREVAAKLARR